MLKILEHPILGRGFRPFFFMGGLYSAVTMFIWGAVYSGYISLPPIGLDPASWHAHEMVFGFTIAIVAGFLLTAVANWTGEAPIKSKYLFFLCAIWLLGRMVVNIDVGLPNGLIVAAGGAFLPVLLISLALPVIRTGNKRNFVFLVILAALAACDITFLITGHLGALHIAVMMIVAMISIIGGRVIPAFTVSAMRRSGIEIQQISQVRMDVLAGISLLCVAFALIFFKDSAVLMFCALVSACVHAIRMRHYHVAKALRDPMLWVLQLGYVWVIVGLFLLGMVGAGLVQMSIAIHALTAGAIGTMTLGMMSRVSLGHTGRALKASQITVLSFIFIQIAAVLRVFGPILFPAVAQVFFALSALLWSMSFLIYVFVYGRMLWSPRPDGRAP